MEPKMQLSVPDYCDLKRSAYMLSAVMDSVGNPAWVDYFETKRVSEVLIAVAWTVNSIVNLVEKMQHATVQDEAPDA